MDEIVICRHGESVASAAGIKNGNPDTDEGLTVAGEEQAQELARHIAGDPIGICVTSQFPRTQETAALALAGREIPRMVDPNLNDVAYGEFEGQPKARYNAWAQEHSIATPVPNGESRVQVASRLCVAVDAILARSERAALVVTHELLIDDLLRAVDGRGPEQVHDDVPYATPYRLPSMQVSRAIRFLRDWIATVGGAPERPVQRDGESWLNS